MRLQITVRNQVDFAPAVRALARPKPASQGTGQIIVAAIAARAPRRTGALAGSFSVTPEGAGGAEVISSVPYAGVINYGWPARGIAPAHFIEPAIEHSEPQWLREWERLVESST